MGSLTVVAAQQTVLRLLEGQQTCNGEMNNTHKICRKSHIGRSRGGWMVKERQYVDLDLLATMFSVQITTIVCFCNVTASPTAHNTQSTTFLCPKIICKICLICTKSLRPHFCHSARCCCCTCIM